MEWYGWHSRDINIHCTCTLHGWFLSNTVEWKLQYLRSRRLMHLNFPTWQRFSASPFFLACELWLADPADDIISIGAPPQIYWGLAFL